MATAMYLEHYLDSLESLPTELKRNFTLMADLDTRAQVRPCPAYYNICSRFISATGVGSDQITLQFQN